MYFVEILQTKNIAIGVPQDSHQHHVHELSSGVTIYSRDSGLNFVRIIIIVRNIFPGCKPWNLYELVQSYLGHELYILDKIK